MLSRKQDVSHDFVPGKVDCIDDKSVVSSNRNKKKNSWGSSDTKFHQSCTIRQTSLLRGNHACIQAGGIQIKHLLLCKKNIITECSF